MERGYIARTFVSAKSVTDALKKLRGRPPDEIYLSDDWMKLGKMLPEEASIKGFKK